MAAYPTYEITLDSTQELESGIDDDFSQSGIQHSRILHGKQYYRFSLVHIITRVQFASLLATYAAGPRDTYTLTYYDFGTSPLTTFSVKFVNPPMIRKNIGGSLVEVESNLRGFKD